MLKFEVLNPDGSVASIEHIDKLPVKVGSLKTNDLIIKGDGVAITHAQIDAAANNNFKVKNRSGNATLVNDKAVDRNAELLFMSGAVLSFGSVRVRVSAVSEQASAPALPTDASAAPDAPAIPVAPAIPAASAAKPAMAKSAGLGGFGAATAAVPKKIIRKKRPTSYERRFLSEKCPSGKGQLEVALLWRGDVVSLKQFKTKPGTKITIGSRTPQVDFGIEDMRLGGEKVVLVCEGEKWKLHFSPEYDGFLVVDPTYNNGNEKIPFKDCASGYQPASIDGATINGMYAADIDGVTRAKIQFGEVSLLVHLASPAVILLPLFGGVNKSVLGGLIASLVIHFALFSVMLFATDRVDALMIDRILTTSRFAEALVQPPEEEEEVDDEDEQELEDPTEESDEVADSTPSPVNSNNNNVGQSDSKSQGLSRAEAESVARSTGLLAQANAMNSMLAVGSNLDNMDLDWSSFDANTAAASAGYGLGMTGGGGGGAAMGGFGTGGFGPGGGGRGGGGAVGQAARAHTGNLGQKGQGTPKLKALNPEVTGSLDKRVIQKIVRQHFGELRSCFEKEAQKIAGLNGRVTVRWLISPQGIVTSANVIESTIKNKNVETCVANSVKHWRFPQPKGGGAADITYPFVFELGSN